MFHYCGYWRTWSRVLSENQENGQFVEVNLTPIQDVGALWERDVAPIRIRRHGTARDYGEFGRDRCTEQLPENVRLDMEGALGRGLTERLLTEDFLPQIDWDLYRQKCNAGASLEDIRLHRS